MGTGHEASSSSPAGTDVGATVTVRIASFPSGALVLDAKSGRIVGETPFEAAMRRGDKERELVLRKPGYHPKSVAIDLNRGSDLRVTLVKRLPAVDRAPDDSDDDRRKL